MTDRRRTHREQSPARDTHDFTNRHARLSGSDHSHASNRGDDEVTAAVLDVADPLVVMRRIAAQALVLVPAADGAVVELAGGDTLTYVCAAGTLRGSVGTRLAHAGSLSGLAMRSGQIQVCIDAATDDRVDRVACQHLGIASMVCVPLRHTATPITSRGNR